jgi:hypothetical protein
MAHPYCNIIDIPFNSKAIAFYLILIIVKML